MDNKQDDKRYRPRQWIGEPIEAAHWFWDPHHEEWSHEVTHATVVLWEGDTFLPPNAPKPTEPPPSDIEDCSTVDWADFALREVDDPDDRLDAIEARLAAIEALLVEMGR